MKCSNCGYESNGTYYCPKCGSPMVMPVGQDANYYGNAPVAGTAVQISESKQKTIRIAIISAAAVILAIVIAITSVLIYNSSITAMAADSVIYNDSYDDYCVVIKNSKKEIVSKEIIKPYYEYRLDLDNGIYSVNMKNLNVNGDTIYFRKIKIVSDNKNAATVQLNITEDFDETDDFDDKDFDDDEDFDDIDIDEDETEDQTTVESVDEYDLYQTIIDDYAEKCNDENHSEFFGYCPYCCYAYCDIDDNGVDELIIQEGLSEQDKVHHVYTVKNNKTVNLGKYNAWHLALYDDNGKLVGVDGTGGIGNVYSIEIKGDTVKQTVTDTFKDGFPSYPNYIEFTTLE